MIPISENYQQKTSVFESFLLIFPEWEIRFMQFLCKKASRLKMPKMGKMGKKCISAQNVRQEKASLLKLMAILESEPKTLISEAILFLIMFKREKNLSGYFLGYAELIKPYH
ncbi:MAG: hypothetical protein LBP76_07300 [Treponema sp.]|jgi:hypothetical protein|nr:hypothetical protein [Treponema sp.]